MKFKSLVFALTALLLSACSRLDGAANQPADVFVADGKGIIGGEAVEDDDPIASRTALLINLYHGSICTVSILNEEWLLTAAHCVVDVEPKGFHVAFTGSFYDYILGLHQEDVRLVENYFVHPAFVETIDKINEMVDKAKEEGRELTKEEVDSLTDWGDIALIRIQGKIPASKTPVALMDPATVLEKGQAVVLAGYGRTGTEWDEVGGELRKVTVTISEPAWGKTEVLLNNSGTGACYGDSGGPAYVYVGGEYRLFGVTSRGVGGSGCDHFSVYTNAVSYLNWIRHIIETN